MTYKTEITVSIVIAIIVAVLLANSAPRYIGWIFFGVAVGLVLAKLFRKEL